MNPRSSPSDATADALLVLEIFAVDPFGLGGIVLRGGPGSHRDLICATVRELLPKDAPFLRVPIHISEDRLLGGVALAETLQSGRLVVEAGLLARANDGVVVLAMAERLEGRVTSHLCVALDRGQFPLERDGVTLTIPSRFGVIALDEGLEEEAPPPALRDRLAFHIDLTRLDARTDLGGRKMDRDVSRRARERLPRVTVGADIVEALCKTALAAGIVSLRAPMLAALAARAHAALRGGFSVGDADVVAAARLVLGPRATQSPEDTLSEPEVANEDAESSSDSEQHGRDSSGETAPERETDPNDDSNKSKAELEEMVLEATKSGIPKGLLDSPALAADRRRMQSRSAGRAGDIRTSSSGGRPAGVRAALRASGERINVVETLRAAAPWQRLRRQSGAARDLPKASRRIEVRRDDFRVTRYKQPTETSVIFSVDASGSAALQRLAEAKGAVEQVLADCYVRRDQVALVAFRGSVATLLLSPTRSLARVRRCLADLAGGGSTPLAAGIDAALGLAAEARKRGRTPVLVLMTDGRANVAKDGRLGSSVASADALASAKAVRAAGVRALFLDTAPRPRPEARMLASEMGARYLPLPYLNAAGISRHVQALVAGTT